MNNSNGGYQEQDLSTRLDSSRAIFLLEERDKAEKERILAEEKLATKIAENIRLRKELEELRVQKKTGSNNNPEILARVKNLANRVENLLAERETLRREVSRLEAEVASLRDELEKASQSVVNESKLSPLQALREKLEEKERELEERQGDLEKEKADLKKWKEETADIIWLAVREEFRKEVLKLKLQLKEKQAEAEAIPSPADLSGVSPEIIKREEVLREAEKTLREDIAGQAEKARGLLVREQELKKKEEELDSLVEKKVREILILEKKGLK
jgi:hypothetical protein